MRRMRPSLSDPVIAVTAEPSASEVLRQSLTSLTSPQVTARGLKASRAGAPRPASKLASPARACSETRGGISSQAQPSSRRNLFSKSSPRGVNRSQLGLPPHLLHTFSPTAMQENDGNAHRMRSLGLPQAPRTADGVAADATAKKTMMMDKTLSISARNDTGPTEEEYAMQADAIVAGVDTLRSRHAACVGLSPDEAAKQQLFKDAGGGADGSPKKKALSTLDRLSPVERRERMDMLKYVRRIEPELPPLERPEPATEAPLEQALVQLNSSSQALAKFKREARLEALTIRSDERADHRSLVKDQRLERKTVALAMKRENAMKKSKGALAALAEASGGEVNPGCMAPYPGFKGAWLAIAAMVSFLRQMNEELKFGRMNCRQQHEYVVSHWEDIQDGTMQTGHLVDNVVDLKVRMEDEAFDRRRALIECILSAKVRLRRQRKNARLINNCLHTWQPGAIWMVIQRLGWRFRLLQHWSRCWRRKLRTIREEVSARWRQLEYNVLLEETVEEERVAKKARPLSLEKIIDTKRVSAKDRMEFLRHELRYRRYKMLPAIRFWESESQRWHDALEHHREHQQALKTVGALEEATPLFLFPPPRPSHLPNDDELIEMMVRARRNPESWTPIPPDPRGAWAQRSATEAK